MHFSFSPFALSAQHRTAGEAQDVKKQRNTRDPPRGMPHCRTGFSLLELPIVCLLCAVTYSSNGQKCCLGFPPTKASLFGSTFGKGQRRRTPQDVLCPLCLVLGHGCWAGVSTGPLSCQSWAWCVGNSIPTMLWREGLSWERFREQLLLAMHSRLSALLYLFTALGKNARNSLFARKVTLGWLGLFWAGFMQWMTSVQSEARI